ncbi:sigma-70 family RNA polymerase sigma factor [Nocardioides sp. CER19]|uniref:sigma-70 family RNA polymerase sigma factor n=1 Tax=Nocardioides sp. CER19 TaxID=3038538 RepID=UPI002447CB66|nr:sigma-70 family RNA polymerase sigma factor [Nocardioides sp. CER19]MDH2414431.1 sigma-70 family RNA polymerase sigma factor [Nocardioides sp. CER19]
MNDVQRRMRTDELVDRLRTATDEERAELVDDLAVTNMVLARRIAHRLGRHSQHVLDLEQVAYLALVRAARDFDPTLGHDFLSYAVPCIRGAVKRYFRDSAWLVRPPRTAQAQYLRSDHGDDVVDGVPLRSCLRPYSLDAPDDTAAPLRETLVDLDDRTWEQTEARLMLAPHLKALPVQARRVLHRRFVEDRTQQQIADELGVSQYHVSRLLDRYLRQLRERMTEPA